MDNEFQVGDEVVVDFGFGTYTVLELYDNQVLVRGEEGTFRTSLDSIAHAGVALEVGKAYRTREGKRVVIDHIHRHYPADMSLYRTTCGNMAWDKDGNFCPEGFYDCDIVQPWREKASDRPLKGLTAVVEVIDEASEWVEPDRSCPICYDLGSVEGVPCGRCNFATEAPMSSHSILVAARAAGQSVQVTPPVPEYVPNIYAAMQESDWAGVQKIRPMFAFLKGVTG